MESEQKFSWKNIDKKIVCPLPPIDCRINEGINRYRKAIGHFSDLFISECNACEAKGASSGDPNDWPLLD